MGKMLELLLAGTLGVSAAQAPSPSQTLPGLEEYDFSKCRKELRESHIKYIPWNEGGEEGERIERLDKVDYYCSINVRTALFMHKAKQMSVTVGYSGPDTTRQKKMDAQAPNFSIPGTVAKLVEQPPQHPPMIDPFNNCWPVLTGMSMNVGRDTSSVHYHSFTRVCKMEVRFEEVSNKAEARMRIVDIEGLTPQYGEKASKFYGEWFPKTLFSK